MKLLAPAPYKFVPSDWPRIKQLLDEGAQQGVNDEKALGEIYKKNIHVTREGLQSSSASTITSYDERQPFGCNRKFWFQDVAGMLSPQDPGSPTSLGDVIHKQIEHYLKTGQDALGKEARAGLDNINIIRDKWRVFQVERWIDSLVIDGVRIRGKIDITGRDPDVLGKKGEGRIVGIGDWKSSSSIERWGKTPYQLTKDPQMLIYRQSAEEEGCDEDLWMAHCYFGTKHRESEIVPTRINRQQLADGMGDIINTLRRMKETAKVLDVSQVAPDRKKCREGTSNECPYFKVCPKSSPLAVGATNLMATLFDKFKKAVSPGDHSPPIPPPVIQGAMKPTPPVSTPGATSLFKKPKLHIEDVPAAPATPAPSAVAPGDSPEVAAMKAEIAALEAKQALQNQLEKRKAELLAAEANRAANAAALDAEQQKAAGTSSEAAAALETARLQQRSPVLPPDAPASNPALAADPVPGFDPLPKSLKHPDSMPAMPEQHNPDAVPAAPAKNKGGRPPGAKNKDVLAKAVPVVVVSGTEAVSEGKDFEIIEVSVTQGATVKAVDDPKCYEFLRVDITLKAAVRRGVDLQTARDKIGHMAQEALVAELTRLKPEEG